VTPYRQHSSKSFYFSWKVERMVVHGISLLRGMNPLMTLLPVFLGIQYRTWAKNPECLQRTYGFFDWSFFCGSNRYRVLSTFRNRYG